MEPISIKKSRVKCSSLFSLAKIKVESLGEFESISITRRQYVDSTTVGAPYWRRVIEVGSNSRKLSTSIFCKRERKEWSRGTMDSEEFSLTASQRRAIKKKEKKKHEANNLRRTKKHETGGEGHTGYSATDNTL